MCTLTWLRSGDGYELYFNRDEARTRLPALPPRIQRRGAVDFLCPLDADAGGTWLGVNAYGLSVGLLNGRADAPVPDAPQSRGLLVLDLLDARGSAEVAERLATADLGRRRAFRLIALEPGELLLDAVWDGTDLRLVRRPDAAQPVCSSSLDPEGAQASRSAAWGEVLARGAPDARVHQAFHASHVPERGRLSTCMHRSDARTVSFTITRVGPERVELGYRPGPPCGAA
ncbi:MAG TPA: NRDE family protein, partial [Planctomycetota bacterium]|nr:NRDE family protein [Planctomycetota bacterium]